MLGMFLLVDFVNVIVLCDKVVVLCMFGVGLKVVECIVIELKDKVLVFINVDFVVVYFVGVVDE